MILKRRGGMCLSKNVFNLLLVVVLLVSCFMPLLLTAKAQTYSYTFHGPYDEETGDEIFVNSNLADAWVTIYYNDGTPTSTVVFQDTYTLTPASKPLYFSMAVYYNISGAMTPIAREYWLGSTENTADIYIIMHNPLAQVAVTIRALGGVDAGNLTIVQRPIDGTLRIVEKRLLDSTDTAIFNLEANTVYSFTVINDATTYSFENVNVYTSVITLTLSPLSFPSEILLQYKYLTLYASRPSSTEIMVNYNDANNQTVSVVYTITATNGTVLFSYTEYVSSFSNVWSGANDNETYYFSATVIQSEFGTTTFSQVLGGSAGASLPIDLSILGSWAGVDSTQIVGALIILIVFGCFSAVNAYIGVFAGVVTAAILWWIGWFSSLSQAIIVAAFALVILLSITYWKRRG